MICFRIGFRSSVQSNQLDLKQSNYAPPVLYRDTHMHTTIDDKYAFVRERVCNINNNSDSDNGREKKTWRKEEKRKIKCQR